MEIKNQKICLISAIVLSVFGLTAAFASINTSVRISGTSHLKTSSWDIGFQTPTDFVYGGKGCFQDNPIGGNIEGTPTTAGATIYFQVELTDLNDYVKFDVPIKNNGTIDAKLDQIVKNVNGVDSDLIEVLITDQNGATLTNGMTVDNGGTKTVSIMIKYNDNSHAVSEETETSIGITFLWVQK